MTRRFSAALLLGLGLAGCTMGPDFTAPATPDQPAAFDAHGAPGVAQQVPDAWWTLFDDPVLTALEARVLDANPDVQIAAHHLAQSRLQSAIAGAAALPQVEGNLNATREAQSSRGVISLLGGSGSQAAAFNGAGGTTTGVPAGTSPLANPINLYQIGFDASWEADLWGRVRRSVEAADAAVDAASAQMQAVRITVQAELARDYLQLRGVQADLGLLDQRTEIASRHLALVERRAAGGIATAQEVADDRARLEALRAERPELLGRQTVAMNAMAELLAAPPGALRAQLDAARAVPPTPPSLPIGLPSELTRRRPDIRAAEARLHVATAAIGVAEADLYPRLTFAASGAMQGLQPHQLDEWSARTFGFGPGITLPVFEGGTLRRMVELRRDEQQEAAIAYRRDVLAALHEVDNALAGLAAAEGRQTALDRAEADKARSLTLARAREAAGVGDMLAVLDAQSQALTAAQSSTDSRTERAVRMVQLYKTLGGGWQVADAGQMPPRVTAQAASDASR